MKASNYALNVSKKFPEGVAVLPAKDFNMIIAKLQKLEDIEQAAINLLTKTDGYDSLTPDQCKDTYLQTIDHNVDLLREAVKAAEGGVPI